MSDKPDNTPPTAEATARPWHWHKVGGYAILVSGPVEEPGQYPSGRQILDDGSAGGEYAPSIDVDGPDAALIVTAVNSHSAMLACRRELAHLMHLLEALEWSYVDEARNDRCPMCEGYRWQGHAAGCELLARLNGAWAALAEAEECAL